MLRLAISSDLSFFYGLYMHPETNPWLLYEKMDEASFQPIFYDLINRESLYVFEIDGVLVGMCKLMPQKFRNSHIMYLGGVAIDPQHKGRGLGRIMLKEVLALITSKGYHRVELTVATFNDRAIGLYESIGFVNEGRLKDYTYLASEDRYIDEFVMGLILDKKNNLYAVG
jgi:ribosomal protein S18 acetylase RimI-like enzyme